MKYQILRALANSGAATVSGRTAKATKETDHATTAVEDASAGTGQALKMIGHGVKKGVDGFVSRSDRALG